MAAVSATFGLKRFLHRHHCHVHGAQHISKHVVGFNLQVVGLQLNRHMAVAEVIGRTGQIKRRAMLCTRGDAQHFLRRGVHLYQRAVFEHQHIATTHQGAARQEHTEGTASGVGCIEATFLAHVPIKLDSGSTFQQHSGQTLAASDQFRTGEHQNKK